MEKEANRLTRHCKVNIKSKKTITPLEEVISSQLTEELMEQFQITEEKRDKLREVQAAITRKTKLKELKQRLQPLYYKVPRLNQSHKDIRTYAEMGPSIEMSGFQELSIRHRVCARGLEQKYPKIIENIMEDAKVEFVRITHEAGVSIIL